VSVSRIAGAFFLALAAVAVFAAPLSADLEKEFRAAKGPILQLMRSKQVDNRIKGLEQLGEFPLVDAAKVLVQVGFKSQPPEVRRAAYETLLKWSDDEDIAAFLNGIVRRDVHRKMISDDSVPIVAALLASKSPDVDQDSLELVDKSITWNRPRALPLLNTLADEFGERGEDSDLRALAKLSKAKSFSAEFGFRRAVVQGVIRIHTPESIELLIGLLADVKGEIRADIVDCLQKASGQAIEADHEKWAAWWQANKATFAYPAVAVSVTAAAPRSLSMATSASYYGMPIYAQRLVFILDTSGSMHGARLMAAKRELMYAINALDNTAAFNIIIFNTGVSVWRKQMSPADQATKRAAGSFVESQVAHGQTASFDALEAGFNFDAESLYFLTDGEPFGGKIQKPADIVTVITKANHPRRLSIYTLGIGVGSAGGPSDDFLQTLAEKNFGSYRRIDQ